MRQNSNQVMLIPEVIKSAEFQSVTESLTRGQKLPTETPNVAGYKGKSSHPKGNSQCETHRATKFKKWWRPICVQ